MPGESSSAHHCPECAEDVPRCSECLHVHDSYDHVGPSEHMCQWCLMGDYGNDPDTNTVWAVLNHNSTFAIASVPEPAVGTLLGFGIIGLLARRRRA